MNNEIIARLETLETILDNQQRKYRRSMIATIICYAVLLVFVIIYTTFVMSQVNNHARRT